MIASTTIFYDTRRPLKDGTYPIKIKLTYQRQRKYYLTGISLSKEDYQKVFGERPRKHFKDIKLELQAREQKAVGTIRKLPVFSFEAFEKEYLNQLPKGTDVFSVFDQYIAELHKQGRANTAISYGNASQSLKQYWGKKNLPFAKVTPEWLMGYELYMVGNGKSLTTVGIYLRSLRIILNLAIEDGLMQKGSYPFSKRKYQIPAGRNVKKALTLEDIQKFFDYEPQTEAEAKARDLFLFSYLCNGINMKDIARLRYRNIQDDKVTFVRAKTERTSKKHLKPIVAVLTTEAKEIIQRWGNKPVEADSLIFDITTDELTPQKEVARIKQGVKTTNKYLKRIAQNIGIKSNISTYTARHSFSTILKRSGAPIEFISESLGHHDLRTTESYLDSFEDDVKKQYASVLTSFRKNN